VRDKTRSYFLGAEWQFSAFWMGFQFPNLSRRIFGEGALTAAFVPVYTDLLHKKGQEAANRFASSVVSLLVMVLLGLTVIGEAIAIPIALSPGITGQSRIAAAMIAIMLPYCLMVCLVALLGAIATVHEKFAAQSLSPIILNLLTAAAAGLSVLVMTTGYPAEQRIFWVAVSVLVAGIVQVALMLPAIGSSGVRLRLAFRGSTWSQAGVPELLKVFLPIMLASSAVQINTFLDTQFAWFLSPDGHDGRTTFQFLGYTLHTAMGPGAGAKLSMAQRIYMLPVGIFGVAVAMAIFPAMARASSAGDMPELKRLLVSGLRKTLFLSIPSSFGMMLVARPLLMLVYGGGKTTLEDVDRAYWAALFFCAGIWAFEAQMVILRVFFVLKDTRTPTRLSLAMILLNFALNISLVWFLREGGLALATTLAAVVQCAILLLILRRRLGRLGMRFLAVDAGKSLVIAVVMVQIGYLVTRIPMPWEAAAIADPSQLFSARLLTACVKLPLLVGACGAVYVGLARFLGMPEVYELPLIGRLLRRR
jgi:putative peptidoglycan lipid II flippase